MMPTGYEIALVLLVVWLLTLVCLGLAIIFYPIEFSRSFKPHRNLVDFIMFANITTWLLMLCFRFWPTL